MSLQHELDGLVSQYCDSLYNSKVIPSYESLHQHDKDIIYISSHFSFVCPSSNYHKQGSVDTEQVFFFFKLMPTTVNESALVIKWLSCPKIWISPGAAIIKMNSEFNYFL